MDGAKPATPAARLIARYGVETLASWSGRHRSRVHAWCWPVSRGGTGGAVPSKVRPAIIDGARRDLGDELTYRDFEPQDGEAYLPADQPEMVR